ncbi:MULTISPECIES: hypothetical protein [unclassified Xanthomonas]|uniref:hypothetical protein n=1 Tax=Xanthomonas sp. LMG 8992 TaxID=1591157 RepID=UPI00136FC29F|nr:hypothetical protein [Xanthomonas sp. LMG 8992]
MQADARVLLHERLPMQLRVSAFDGDPVGPGAKRRIVGCTRALQQCIVARIQHPAFHVGFEPSIGCALPLLQPQNQRPRCQDRIGIAVAKQALDRLACGETHLRHPVGRSQQRSDQAQVAGELAEIPYRLLPFPAVRVSARHEQQRLLRVLAHRTCQDAPQCVG